LELSYDCDPDPMLLNVGLPRPVLLNVALSPALESVNANTR
jgi:hypothetical protein